MKKLQLFFLFFRYGNIDLDLTFAKALPNPIQAMIFYTYNGGLTVNDKLEVKLLET